MGTNLAIVRGGLACLFVGLAVKHTRYAGLETILNVAFGASCLAVVFSWLRQGETTSCPECGRQLWSAPDRDRSESLKFTCEDCQIEWDTDGLHDM